MLRPLQQTELLFLLTRRLWTESILAFTYLSDFHPCFQLTLTIRVQFLVLLMDAKFSIYILPSPDSWYRTFFTCSIIQNHLNFTKTMVWTVSLVGYESHPRSIECYSRILSKCGVLISQLFRPWIIKEVEEEILGVIPSSQRSWLQLIEQ